MVRSRIYELTLASGACNFGQRYSPGPRVRLHRRLYASLWCRYDGVQKKQ